MSPPRNEFPDLTGSRKTQPLYAGFWRRAVAILIDMLVLIPLVVLHFFLFTQSAPLALSVSALSSAVGLGYYVILHWKLGQSVGKMAMRLKVTCLDHTPIGLHEALLRYIVEIGWALIALTALAYTFATWNGPAWGTLDRTGQHELFLENHPFAPWGDYAWMVWIGIEILVLVATTRKRAVHDFIAGTVVLNLRHPMANRPTTDEPAAESVS